MVTTNRSVPAGPAMRAQDVFEVLDLAASVEATIWLDGGWGVDALLGHQTRPHADLDITVEEHHVPALEDLLSERGFRRVDRAHERPWNFVLADRVGRRIDVHVVVLDNAGNGIYGRPENGEQYPATSLTGRGSVEGRVVQCISPEWMVLLLDRRPIGDHARDIVAYVRLVAELRERVVAQGGPLDGTEIDVARGADEVAVEMADRSIHGYVRTDGARLLQSGARGAMFRWIGRQ